MSFKVVSNDDWIDFMTAASQTSCEVCFLSAFVAFLRQREMEVPDGIKRLRVHIQSMGSRSLDCMVGLATSLTLLSLSPCDVDNRSALQPELAVVLKIIAAYRPYIPMSSLSKVREVCTAILTARNRIQAISASLEQLLAPKSKTDLIANSEGTNEGKKIEAPYHIHYPKHSVGLGNLGPPPSPSHLTLKSMKTLKSHLNCPFPSWTSDREFLDRKVRLIEWKVHMAHRPKDAKTVGVSGHTSNKNVIFSSFNSAKTRKPVLDEREELIQQLDVAEDLLRNLLFCLVELKSRHRRQSQAQAVPFDWQQIPAVEDPNSQEEKKRQPVPEDPFPLPPNLLERLDNAQTYPPGKAHTNNRGQLALSESLPADISSNRVSRRLQQKCNGEVGDDTVTRYLHDQAIDSASDGPLVQIGILTSPHLGSPTASRSRLISVLAYRSKQHACGRAQGRGHLPPRAQ